MQLSILIVNWNTGDQLRDCLFSIAKYAAGHVSKVVVVDNASNDFARPRWKMILE